MDRNQYFNEKGSTSHGHGSRSDYHYLMAEMKAQNFDVIRFATYRTALKLRFIQKKTHLHLVDVWNIIEAFRENGLNTLEARTDINVSRLETLISSIYYQLNKRIPVQQQIDVEHCSALLANWLLATYDPETTGKVRVFSMKIALAIICSGKISDKLRYIFSLISDVNGHLVFGKFADFLKEAMAIPCSVYESPSFYFTDSLPRTIFDGQSVVSANDFLDILLADPGPQCLMWFPLHHRMASVETVLHSVQCEGCNKESFLGFRYKCQQCYNYHLCQDCFWKGRVSGNHTNQHEMKEYTSYKTPGKQLSHSLKKSFRCGPDKPMTSSIPRYPDGPERPMNLSHIVPAAPLQPHNSIVDPYNNLQYDNKGRQNAQPATDYDFYPGDEEHRLIGRYTNHLADNNIEPRTPSEAIISCDTMKQRELISKLEVKNREIMREIVRLRKQQEQEDIALHSDRKNPTLLAELRALRQRKEELESHLSNLQESRRELVLQLEVLMRMLKGQSPHSSPNSSPFSLLSRSPPMSLGYPWSSVSAPASPGHSALIRENLMGLGGDVRLAFGQPGMSRSLQNDLLVAADSVTNAMSSLVKELNYGPEDDENMLMRRSLIYPRDFYTDEALASLNETLWPDEIQRLREIEYENEIQNQLLEAEVQDDLYDSMEPDLYNASLVADEDNYIQPEDEDLAIEWEDNMRRWVNR